MSTVAANKYIKYIFAFCSVFFAAAAITLCGGAYAEQAENADPATIVIVAGGKNFEYRDERIEPSDFTVAEQIEARRINAPLESKLELVNMYLSKGADYKTALSVCFPLLERAVDEAAAYLYVEPVDASVRYDGKKFYVTSDKTGRALDENRLYANIYYILKYSGGGSVSAKITELLPEVTANSLRAELKLRGSYTTEYASSTEARAHNVALALKKFDGLKIEPSACVSFNETVGARTETNGFKKAKIIVDGKYTDGVGGGVCQASTAVYNAALLAGLHCSANAHSICPSYCPPGLDAMISGYSDLVITNTTDRAVRISVSINGRSACVKIYGEQKKYNVVPESVVVKTVDYERYETVDTARKYFDVDAQSGDRRLVSAGKLGYVSETYLNYYDLTGAFVKRVQIRTNEYKSTPQVIAVAP